MTRDAPGPALGIRLDGGREELPVTAQPWPLATTRIVALLGWPARYSLSPAMHNAAFRDGGLDLVYVVLPCRTDDLSTVVRALAATDAVGANVTVPHKAAAFTCCDRRSPEAELLGVVNTLVFGEDGVLGDNTDAAGLRDAWVQEAPDATGRVTVLGTGGAARASVVAAGRLGGEVVVCGRRPAAAEAVAELARAAGAPQALAVDDSGPEAGRAVRDATMVVNATPLGMSGESLPDPFMRLSSAQVAYDLVYGPARTPFVAAAEAAGARAYNGVGMLVAQAGRSFERWTGIAPDLALMTSVVRRSLAERTSGT